MTNIIGIIGAGLLLVSFMLNQLHKLSRDSTVYDLINFLGALLLVIYALDIGSYPFAILNGVWTLVSLRDILKPKS